MIREQLMETRFSSVAPLGEVLAGRGILKRGDSGQAVSVVQQALHDMGFAMMVLQDGVGVSGVDGAFGKRILDLSWASGVSHGEELHGTYDYPNMGRDVSHGCVRHYNEDIIRIFNAVDVGDYVAIVTSVADPMLT